MSFDYVLGIPQGVMKVLKVRRVGVIEWNKAGRAHRHRWWHRRGVINISDVELSEYCGGLRVGRMGDGGVVVIIIVCIYQSRSR